MTKLSEGFDTQLSFPFKLWVLNKFKQACTKPSLELSSSSVLVLSQFTCLSNSLRVLIKDIFCLIYFLVCKIVQMFLGRMTSQSCFCVCRFILFFFQMTSTRLGLRLPVSCCSGSKKCFSYLSFLACIQLTIKQHLMDNL